MRSPSRRSCGTSLWLGLSSKQLMILTCPLRFKNGQEVRADARIKISRDCTRLETYNLTLNLIKREDAGDYEVKATNTLGSASTLSHVKVLSK